MTGASRSSLPTASKARNRIARPLMMRPAQSPFREAAAVPVSVARGARAGSIDFPLSIPSMRAVSLSGRKQGFRAVWTDSPSARLKAAQYIRCPGLHGDGKLTGPVGYVSQILRVLQAGGLELAPGAHLRLFVRLYFSPPVDREGHLDRSSARTA